MSHESARRGPTRNAENRVGAACKRSCNSLQTSCKRAGEGGPGGEGNDEVPGNLPTRSGWPATTTQGRYSSFPSALAELPHSRTAMTKCIAYASAGQHTMIYQTWGGTNRTLWKFAAAAATLLDRWPPRVHGVGHAAVAD
jgi:hypothetical protein